MSGGPGLVGVLSCGIFRDEYQLLPEALRRTLDPVFLDSMLHMDPEKLDDLLARFLQKHEERPELILFGDCCPHMQEIGSAAGVARTEGANCCEIYLGRDCYRRLRKERTFFLMPEWAERWEHVVKKELGLLSKELARDFMTQSMSKAVYIDTGVIPVPEQELAAFGEYTGLAVEVAVTGPEHFIAAVQAALRQLEQDDTPVQAIGGKSGDGRELKKMPETLSVADDLNAFNQFFSELVERLLSVAESPGKSADYLAESLRSLIGAKTVLVMQCPQHTHHERHEIVSVFPERRYFLGNDETVQELCELSHGFEKAQLFTPDAQGDISAALRRLESGPALISPLQSGGARMGVLLLLDLMDASGLKTILSTLDRLSAVLALVLRNAFLYNNLEEIVAQRTRQLELHTAALANSLREREVMLKEVHHRVKNNLQIVNSLLYLQASLSDDPGLQEALRKGQQRILSMAMIHEELYKSEDLSSVDLCAYTRRLCDGFTGMTKNRIEVHSQNGQVLLPITLSIPCGLILNEFLTNALKYAYPEGREGEIRVQVTETKGRIQLVVEDDGVGLPADPGQDNSSEPKPGALGLSLVHGLVDQLDGTLSISSSHSLSGSPVEPGGGNGARFAVSFGREGHE